MNRTIITDQGRKTLVVESRPWEIEPLKVHPSSGKTDKYLRESSNGGNKKWFGVSGGSDEVIRLRETGWKEGMNKARRAIGDISEVPRLRDSRRRRHFGDQGDTIHMDRVYSGQLDQAWESRQREVRSGFDMGVIRILVGLTTSCGVSGEKMFWRGAAAAVLAEALELAGRPVEIVAYSHVDHLYGGYNGEYEAQARCDAITVKASGDPLDLDGLAATLCLSGYYRYYIFKAKCSEPTRAATGLGSVLHNPPDFIVREGDMVINKVWSKEGAQQFVKDTITGYNKGQAQLLAGAFGELNDYDGDSGEDQGNYDGYDGDDYNY